jgi:catechol 2,3-dioxygenase-like lactoylglutathione lyase family enzyme
MAGSQHRSISLNQRMSRLRRTAALASAVEGFWLSVSSLARSLSFYREVLGLPLQSADAPATDSMLRNLAALPGAGVHSVTLGASGTPSLRLIQFSMVGRRSQRPHSVDPGAAMLEFSVPDLEAVLRVAARLRTPIVTRGAAPLRLRDGSRAVVLLDPDGYFVALFQPAATTPGRASSAVSLGMRLTVAAPGTMVRFYQQALGIPLRAGEFTDLGDWSALLGTQSSAQWAATQTHPAGAALQGEELQEVQFVAFRHVTRRTFSGRPQDPGTPTLSLRLSNLAPALRAIRSAGLRVLSAGGQPVSVPGGGATLLFRDPAGVLVDLVQR